MTSIATRSPLPSVAILKENRSDGVKVVVFGVPNRLIKVADNSVTSAKSMKPEKLGVSTSSSSVQNPVPEDAGLSPEAKVNSKLKLAAEPERVGNTKLANVVLSASLVIFLSIINVLDSRIN